MSRSSGAILDFERNNLGKQLFFFYGDDIVVMLLISYLIMIMSIS